jgi:predicted nucleotidyltransferase
MESLTREEAMNRLVAAEAEIRAFGVERLKLFGSVMRDESRAATGSWIHPSSSSSCSAEVWSS